MKSKTASPELIELKRKLIYIFVQKNFIGEYTGAQVLDYLRANQSSTGFGSEFGITEQEHSVFRKWLSMDIRALNKSLDYFIELKESFKKSGISREDMISKIKDTMVPENFVRPKPSQKYKELQNKLNCFKNKKFKELNNLTGEELITFFYKISGDAFAFIEDIGLGDALDFKNFSNWFKKVFDKRDKKLNKTLSFNVKATQENPFDMQDEQSISSDNTQIFSCHLTTIDALNDDQKKMIKNKIMEAIDNNYESELAKAAKQIKPKTINKTKKKSKISNKKRAKNPSEEINLSELPYKKTETEGCQTQLGEKSLPASLSEPENLIPSQQGLEQMINILIPRDHKKPGILKHKIRAFEALKQAQADVLQKAGVATGEKIVRPLSENPELKKSFQEELPSKEQKSLEKTTPSYQNIGQKPRGLKQKLFERHHQSSNPAKDKLSDQNTVENLSP